MTTSYRELSHELLASGTTLLQRHGPEAGSVTLADGAERVYTDFTLTRPFTISSMATLREINDKMIACGVRLLFVAEGDQNLQGLVTHSDLFGEKAVRHIQEHGGKHDEILARYLMTPLARLQALQRRDVLKASVGDIIQTIQAAGRQHMLVCDTNAAGQQTIIGLFSSTQIEKLTGLKIELSARAHTFADLERALA
jgi:predicted transcriptional regulator